MIFCILCGRVLLVRRYIVRIVEIWEKIFFISLFICNVYIDFSKMMLSFVVVVIDVI